MELLESNNLLAGWSGFELRSTPLQSKKITALYCEWLSQGVHETGQMQYESWVSENVPN